MKSIHREEYKLEKHRKMQPVDAVGTLFWSLYFTTVTYALLGVLSAKS